MMKTVRGLAAFAAFALAAAAPMAIAESSRDPVITEARANGANTILQVIGTSFSGGTPRLALGAQATPLIVTFFNATRIEALLPPGIEPGTYLLTLSVGKSKEKSGDSDDKRGDEFWVTLGAQGPAGPQGPAGLAGPAGATGQQGLAGPVGATGLQGSAGAAGKDGVIGPAGAPGKDGAIGPQGFPGKDGKEGAPGPAGPQGPIGLQGATGAPGLAGPPGPVGATGPQGPAGAGGTPTTHVVSVNRNRAPADAAFSLIQAEAHCPAGSLLTGGSATIQGYVVFGNGPVSGANTWVAYALTPPDTSLGPGSIQVTAVCLRFG